MTYNELLEIGEVAFDEYLPKVSAKARRAFLDALFTELEDVAVLEIEDEITPDTTTESDDEIY